VALPLEATNLARAERPLDQLSFAAQFQQNLVRGAEGTR
jgi:hypothetical protein